MSELIVAARVLAASLLDTAEFAQRWRHVQGVAARADQLAGTLDPADRSVLVAAGWLHDIGYAPAVVDTGMHAIDGARHLRDHNWPPRLSALVAHHSAARLEAAERGLIDRLEEFPLESGPVMDALVAADLTVGPDGQPLGATARIDEILSRYPPQTAVHRAVVRAKPVLLAHVQRALARPPYQRGT